MRRSIFPLVLAVVLALPASASARNTPTMKVTGAGPAEDLAITDLDVEARIVGHLAETSMTMTFHNPFERALEGDLMFPLPDGATVSGYALDVNGVLVDGVVVKKEKARRVFETEVRKAVDPGIVEKVGGAAYRTRVFPIPAGGTRIVKVSWISEVDLAETGASYRLPLAFTDPIADVHLRIEVVRSTSARVAGRGIEGLRFDRWEDRQVAETRLKNARLDTPVVIELPDLARSPVAVERASDGIVYFSIHGTIEVPASTPRLRPRRAHILWDASLSRAGADHDAELAVLEAWLQDGPVRRIVDVTAFADTPLPTRTFALPEDGAALLDHLRSVQYDGGTRLAALSGIAASAEPVDVYLLFSDGVSNLGERDLPVLPAPVFALSGAGVADHDALRVLSLSSGGARIDLSRLDTKEAVAAIGRVPFIYRGADEAAGLGATHPRVPEATTGPYALAGILEGDGGDVTLRFGDGSITKTVTVRADDAVEGDLLRRYWAQRKVADLAVGGKHNEAAMTAVGTEFGIVTPGTSLLVLERLEQYVEHRVRPPASLVDMRAEYDRRTRATKLAKAQVDEDKLESMVALWNERVAWWEKEFRFRKRPSKIAKGSGPFARAFGGLGARAERAAPAPMEDAAEMDVGAATPAASARTSRSTGDTGPEATIALRPWDPQTPYIDALKAADPADRETVYLRERSVHGGAPAFFLDCADFFAAHDRARAMRVLSNLVELDLEDPALLRIYAHRLVQVEELDLAILTFDRVRELRPEEPQSHRDLALALDARGRKRAARPANAAVALADYQRAMDLLGDVVMKTWDRFAEIELIALVELNDILPRARELGPVTVPVDERLIRRLDMDVRIVMSWDADLTDMDLHVLEPSGEEAYYGHARTFIGGRVSRDFTQGYGPEEYSIRRAMAGTYTIRTKFFGSSAARLQGAVTLQVDLYTNYGRENQRKRSITLRLAESKDTFTVGEIAIDPEALRAEVTRR